MYLQLHHGARQEECSLAHLHETTSSAVARAEYQDKLSVGNNITMATTENLFAHFVRLVCFLFFYSVISMCLKAINVP